MYGYGYGRNSINMDTEYETTYSFGPSAYARKMSKSQKMMSVESEKEHEEEAHEEEHEEEATQQNGENENTQREGNGRRRFEGKVAIITESNCGIDRAAAILMGKEGAKVTVQGTEEMELRRTIVLMVRQGVSEDNILVVQGSILEDQTLNRLVDKTIEKFERIDILVNNAVSENKNKKQQQQQQQREEEYDPYQNNNNYNSGSRYGNNTSSKFNNDYSQYNGTSDRRDSSRNTREKNNTISRYPGFQGFRRQSRFNAAGMYDTGGGSSRDFDSFRRHDDDFDFLFNINLKSITKLTRLCAPYLEDTKGAVVNVSSFGTQRAVHDYAYYNTIKSALDNYCRSIAIKFAKRAIRVNNVNPGFVTCEEMDDDEQAANKFELNWIKNHVPMGRGGAAEEIAKVIAFLASDDASYVTGATIVADGAVSIYSKPADFF